MRIRWMLTAAALIASHFPVRAADARVVDVYLNAHDETALLFAPAKALASRIFEQIGVRLVWHLGEPPAGRVAAAFAIRTAAHPLPTATREALASTRIEGTRGAEIVIYQDRLQSLLASHSSIVSVAAAYVLVHELAHELQGVARHSETGILKAHWDQSDYQEMAFQKLRFTPLDIDLIYRGTEQPAVTIAAAN